VAAVDGLHLLDARFAPLLDDFAAAADRVRLLLVTSPT
jgi:hypothetical protein